VAPYDIATARYIIEGISSPEANVRKGATFAAYNFALNVTKSDDEAVVYFVTGLGSYLTEPKDKLESYEFLSVVLSTGTILYGHLNLVSLFRKSFKGDLNKFR
jgi:hypothetical protein